MRMKYAQCLCGIAIALSGVASMRAQDVRIMHFKGVINDYSPSNSIRRPVGNSRRMDLGRGTDGHGQFFGGPDHRDVRLRDFRYH